MTVMNAKNLDSIIGTQEFSEEENSGNNSSSSKSSEYDPMKEQEIQREIETMDDLMGRAIDEDKSVKIRITRKSAAQDKSHKFDASFDTPPEEDNMFFENIKARENKKTVITSRRGMKFMTDNPNDQNDGLDLLAQIEQQENKNKQLEDEDENDDALAIFEQNMEQINSRQPQSIIVNIEEIQGFRQSIDHRPKKQNSSLSKSVIQTQDYYRKQMRTSSSFHESDIKNSLVQSHSQMRQSLRQSEITPRLTKTIQQDEEIKNEYTNQENKSDTDSNNNSLRTEEDLDNYLQQLEDEDERLQKELMTMTQKGVIRSGSDEGEDSRLNLLSAYRSRKERKDLVDIIQEVEEEEDDENGFNSDDSFTREFYQTLHQDVLLQTMSAIQKDNAFKLDSLMKDEWEYKDMIKIIDWNERRYQDLAKQKLKENSVLAQRNGELQDVRTRVMSPFTNLNTITARINKERQFSQASATCIGLSDDLILIGSSEGQVWMFDRENEEEYATFTEKSKEFLGNAVTAIDIHPNRTEYTLLGYERGQLVLYDATDPKKSIKVIKDHHKGIPVVNVKFCDWQGEKKADKEQDNEKSKETEIIGKTEKDSQAWMFISIDKNGKVMVNSVFKQFFMLKVTKHIIIDPQSQVQPEYSAISCRFKSAFHGVGNFDDIPMIAIGNSQIVKILEVRPNAHYELYEIQRPNKYYNKQKNNLDQFWPKNPSLSWGHGHSPLLKERPHTLLAIAWGPLIQIIVLIDHSETDNPFVEDGYHILRNYNIMDSKFAFQPRRKTVKFQNLAEIDKDQIQQDTVIQDQQEPEKKEYDESQAFRQPELFIEQVQFISDSTLMIVTQSQEVRVLHTQAINPGVYKPATILSKTQQGKYNIKEDYFKGVELEHGIKLPTNIMKSVYHQTMRFFHQKLVVLTDRFIQVSNHITWQQSLYEFKREVYDDLVLVFQRALDIYKGKIKGYAGIPDFANVREISLKADLKLLIREIICQVIEKTQETNSKITNMTMERIQPVLDNGGTNSKEEIRKTINQLSEYEEERNKKYQTLIRLSLEFCIELQDCYFLFYDLFLLFQEEKLEEVFVKELEPFIMAGKFQEWELPNEVLQNHVIRYYKNDKEKADALEKIIVNLNFNQCPKTIVLEFIHFSEQNYLTTALLFLYTQVIEKKDNTSCVQVLCSLFDLYKKMNRQSQIVPNATMIDMQMLREFEYDSEEKKQIEKSQMYLGYKILWIIRLFIDGKKFPQGNIREKKWRSYIHDVIQFLSTPEYLKVLLDVDAETFFRIISILFYPSKPFDLVEQGRDDLMNPSLKSLTHLEFLKDLDMYCMHEKTSEIVKFQYLFFVANVVAKSTIQGIESSYFYKVTKDLLAKHRRYLEFNKNLQDMQTKKRLLIQRQKELSEKEKTMKQQMDAVRYVQKTENDFINLFKLSEPLDTFQIQELLKLSEYSQFNQVKIYLLEKKEEYIRCLTLLINDPNLTNNSQPQAAIDIQSQKVINWIKQKLDVLDEKAKSGSVAEKTLYDQFKREIAQNIKKIVIMNPKETIRIVENKFSKGHKDMIDTLARDPLEQMIYLETLLTEQDQEILETIKNYGLQSANPLEAKKFIEFIKMHLTLCCQHKKDKVIHIVEKMAKNSYYPIADCLVICQKFDQIEAAFLLTKKLGKYFESVKLGIDILKAKVDLRKLKVELYFAMKKQISFNFPIQEEFMSETILFDHIFRQIFKICKKNSREVDHDKEELIWYIVIDTLMELKNSEATIHKVYCRNFFQKRLVIFMEALVRVIPFNNFLNYILSKQRNLLFRDFKDIIMTIFSNTNSENVVIQNANNAIFKVNTELFAQFSLQTRKGVLFRQRLCTLCKRYMDSFLTDDIDQETAINSDSEDEEIHVYDSQKELAKIFACKHTFHIRCLHKLYKQQLTETYEAFLKRTEKLRCPTCNLKNFDIDNDSNKGSKSHGKSKVDLILPQATYKQHHDYLQMTQLIKNQGPFMSGNQGQVSELDDDPVSRKIQLRKMRQTMKKVSATNKKLVKITKKMSIFENIHEQEALNINDFKKIR